MHRDLREACLGALKLSRSAVRRHAEKFSWHAATTQLLAALQVIPESLRQPKAGSAGLSTATGKVS